MFHVYVDGVTGTAPDSARRLADAMATRYGLPADELYLRLSRGRFRVKANVDHQTADTYARDLEALGARVRIEQQPDVEHAPRGARPHRTSAPPELAQAIELPRSPVPARRAPSTPPPVRSPASLSPPMRSSASVSPPMRSSASLLPPTAARRIGSPSGAPGRAPTTLPAHAPPRWSSASLPPQPASRRAAPSLPPQPASRQSSSSLPAERASRRSSPSLPPPGRHRELLSPGLPPGPSGAAVPAGRAGRSSLPPQPAQASKSPLPVVRSAGLSADTTDLGTAPPVDATPQLGALERSGLLSLTSLDAELLETREPTRDGLPASIGPATQPPVRPQRPSTPEDPFAPPPSAGGDNIVELADDELERRARKRISAPPLADADLATRRFAPSPSSPPMPSPQTASPWSSAPFAQSRPARSSRPSLPFSSPAAAESSGSLLQLAPSRPPGSPPPPAAPAEEAAALLALAGAGVGAVGAASAPAGISSPRLSALPRSGHRSAGPPLRALTAGGQLLGRPRIRFVAGVALAVVLGFVPAGIVASQREHSAFAAIDERVAAAQAAADSPQSYEALDAFRAEQLEAKYAERRWIIATSVLLWAATGSVLAYVWFRRLPWHRLG